MGETNKCNTSLLIFVTNIRSIRSNLDELKVYLQTINNPYDVLILTEIWINYTEISRYEIPNYRHICNPSVNNRSGGVSVFVKKGLTVDAKCIQSPNYEGLICSIDCLKKKFDILALYRSPANPPRDFINDLQQIFQTRNTDNMICVGDINIDISSQNNVSNEYLDMLSGYGFIPAINTPTRVTENTTSCIDHALLKYNLNTTSEVRVIPTKITDHYSLHIKLNITPKITAPIDMITYIDDECFKNIVNNEHIFQPVLTQTDAKQAYDTFNNILKNAIHESTKMKKLTKQKPRSKWITQELAFKCKEKNKTYKLMRKFPFNEILLKRYNTLTKELKIEIRLAKITYFENLILNAGNDHRKVWEILSKLKGNSREHMDKIKINGVSTQVKDNASEVANYFNEYFCNTVHNLVTSHFPDMTNLNEINLQEQDREPMVWDQIEVNEIEDIIKTLKNKCSSGDDKIQAKLIKQNIEIFSIVLTHITNLCVTQRYFPEQLKMALVTPVFKKGDKEEVTNYRPISILSPISKIIEKAVKMRLIKYLYTINFFAPNQYGFLPNKSTDQALADHITTITKSLEDAKHTVGIYLDQTKAFDILDHDILLVKLYKIGIRGNLLNFFSSYLKNRHQKVKIQNTTSIPKKLTLGVQQGSVLGPLLYVIFLNDFFNLNLNGSTTAFADDISLAYTTTTLDTMTTSVQDDLKQITLWFNKNRMLLNYDKTNMITYNYSSSETTQRPSPKIYMHDKICPNLGSNVHNCDCKLLPNQTETTYLGLRLDSRLSWTNHITELQTKLRKLNYAFYEFRKYLPIKTTRMAYNAWYQSKLTYGIIHWGNSYQYNRQTIQTLQNKTVRILLGIKTNRQSAPFEDLGLPTVRELYYRQTITFVDKNIQNFEWRDTFSTRTLPPRLLLVPQLNKTHSRLQYAYNGPIQFNHILTNNTDFRTLTYGHNPNRRNKKRVIREYCRNLQLSESTNCEPNS